MAGDWIKMRVLLTRDPKVIAIADALAVDRAFMDWLTNPVRRTCDESAYEHVTRSVTVSVTVTGLLQVWGVAREQGRAEGDDLIVDCIGLDALDEIAAVPGLGDALASVGWAIGLPEGGVIFPKFFAHNAPTDEIKRRQATERKRKERDKARDKARDCHAPYLRDSHADSHANVTHRVEKSREEKEKTPQPPATGGIEPAAIPLGCLDTPAFREAWANWLREKRGAKLQPPAQSRQLGKLQEIGPDAAVKCIEHSLMNQYQGLFPEKFAAAAARPNLFLDRAGQAEARAVAQVAERLARIPPTEPR